MAKKRRTRPHPGAQPRPEPSREEAEKKPRRGLIAHARATGAQRAAAAPSPLTPRPAPVIQRLPWKLSRVQLVAVVGIFLSGIASFVGLADGYERLQEIPWLPGALTVVGLFFGFLLERDVLRRAQPKAILRFAGFGLIAPVLVLFVSYAALTPLSVAVGLTAYRLGVGSVTPPSVVAALGTFMVTGNASLAYLMSTAALWPGTGVLLMTRRRS